MKIFLIIYFHIIIIIRNYYWQTPNLQGYLAQFAQIMHGHFYNQYNKHVPKHQS